MVGGSLRVLRILPQITNPRAQQSCAMRPDMAERACYLICDSVRLHDTMDLSKHVDIKFSTHDLYKAQTIEHSNNTALYKVNSNEHNINSTE
jgi:hypothetical protein